MRRRWVVFCIDSGGNELSRKWFLTRRGAGRYQQWMERAAVGDVPGDPGGRNPMRQAAVYLGYGGPLWEVRVEKA